MSAADWGLLIATFLACFVEMVEATTIVLAMGFTREWRSTVLGTVAALAALAVATVIGGYAIATWLPESALQLLIGGLLLIFGLQWLRKAILRSSGRKAMHDEAEEYAEQTEAARAAGAQTMFGLDSFGFVVSFKGVFLEGVEVVFIVITFGLSADNMPMAIIGAAVAGALVIGLGLVLHRPLAAVPENALKYGVGLLLASFGTYWTVEGIGVLGSSNESLEWPGGDWSILVLLALWFVLSRVLVTVLRRPAVPTARVTTESIA